jgi:ABC-type multidrug transport system fused ATPase/permease subunit
MSNPNDFQDRMRQIEQEMYRSAGVEPPLKSADPTARSFDVQSIYGWVNSLTGVAKVVAVVIIGIIAFAVVSFILKLVWAAFTLAMLAVIVFVLYKVFFEPTPTPLE